MPRKTLIQHRRDTVANWKSINPILAAGEIGVETDTNRTKVGDGESTWLQLHYQNVPYYGAFQDSTTQTIGDPTLAYAATFNTTDFSYGVKLENSSNIKFQYSGLYNIQWSGQFTNSNPAVKDISIWFRKNGADLAGSAGHITIPGKHGSILGAVVSSWNYFVQVTGGDYVELMWHADSADVKMEAYPASTSPVVPVAASVILTVQQVM